MSFDSSSYGQNLRPTDQVKAWGVVANIADPLNSGRVQVRMVGYEDNKGTVPDEKLMWYDTDSQGTQIKGVGSSHGYSVGTTVKLENTSGKWTVVGSGTGSGDLKGNSDAVDTKDGGYPKSARKSSPGILDVKLNVKGVDLLGDLTKKIKFDAKSLLKYAADESNGSAAKFKDLPNIGAFMTDGAPNATNFIKGLDPNNLSGAIKTALSIVNNFTKGQLGDLSSMIGSSALSGMLSQLQSSFGPMGLVADASKAIKDITKALDAINKLALNLNTTNLLNNISLIENLPNLLTDPTLNIPTAVQINLQNSVNRISNDVLNNNLVGAIANMSSLMLSVQNVSASITPLANTLANVKIPNLSAADLIKDFAGKLTEIKIPELPKLNTGGKQFPKVPTFDEFKALKAAATAKALSQALGAIQAAAPSISGAASQAAQVVKKIV